MHSFMISLGNSTTDIFGRHFETTELAQQAMDEVVTSIGPERVEFKAYGTVEPEADKIEGFVLTNYTWIKDTTPWVPDFDNLKDGFECLVFHRGKWRHVRWSTGHSGFMFRYAGSMLAVVTDRAWAQLPPKPEGADKFFDWKD